MWDRDDAGLVMSAVFHEEAATDEVVALASVLVRLPHGPVRPADDDDAVPVVDSDDAGEHVVSAALPRQRDEFTCRRCFLVAHVSRRTRVDDDRCTDCD